MESEENIVASGGLVSYWNGIFVRQATDVIYLTNKRIFTRVWIPLINKLLKGVCISLENLIRVSKARWIMDGSLLFVYKADGKDTEKKVCFSSRKKRDLFYDELTKLVPNKCGLEPPSKIDE